MQFKFMPAYQKILINLAIALILSLGILPNALAVTQKLEFDTSVGYKVETIFSYDETQNPNKINEKGHGKTKVIDSMEVSFYKPSGELIASYRNVVDGVVKGNYFEFNFDPNTQQILGSLDIGGESAGEIYLKGEADRELSLIEVNDLGEEKKIARVYQ